MKVNLLKRQIRSIGSREQKRKERRVNELSAAARQASQQDIVGMFKHTEVMIACQTFP